MTSTGGQWTSLLLFFLACLFVTERQVYGQTTTGSNAPDHPLWPLFAQIMSTQYSRTVQDINVLGTSDPFIKSMWTSYVAAMPKLDTQAQTAPVATTPPPLPDLYQASYSFSSNSAVQQQQQKQQQAQDKINPILTQFMSMMNQNPTSSNQQSATNIATSPGQGVTTTQDVMATYNSLNPGMMGSSQPSSDASSSLSTMIQNMMAAYQNSGTQGNVQSSSGASSSGTSIQDILAAYNNLTPGTLGSSQPQQSVAAPSSGTSIQDILAAYNNLSPGMLGSSQPQQSVAAPSSGTSIQDIMAAYNNLTPGTLGSSQPQQSVATPSSGTSIQDILAAYNNLSPGMLGSSQPPVNTGSQTGQPIGGSPVGKVPSSPSSSNPQTQTATDASSTQTFEQQMAELFPQFRNLMTPSTSTSGSTTNDTALTLNDTAPSTMPTGAQNSPQSSSSSGASSTQNSPSSNVIQDLFGSLLFGQSSTGQGQNMGQTGNPMASGGMTRGNLISSHMENTFKARASHDMGCRFLPELLELEIIPTMPLDCRNKCPFPYINAQKFGVYCVCCPPGINQQVIQTMSLLRRRKYLTDNPLAVMS